MKHNGHAKIFALLFIAASALSLSVGSSAAVDSGSPVKIAVEGGFPPFNYVDSKNQLQGFDVDIANALCAAAKLKCEFVMQKWDDMIPGLIDKRYDAIVSSMSMSDERRQKVAFTAKYYDSPSVFIVRKGSNFRGLTPEDLKGAKLGVTSSTVQQSYIKDFYPGAQVTVFEASPELYTGLANGSVDIILEDKLAIYDWLTNTREGECCEFKGQDIKNKTYFGEGAGIALRKEDSQLQGTLNTALEQIKSDGTYDMINAKYFPFSIQ
ncbi:transporter substrate-binding domain-containing protein [Oryzifoliimicrobium ureilyticus]|uniref:transporter substrate-binding domain-containing protein n=1 Tax=Oryzifoliimicrobium ureilyticus TaxID=3113724 RepID=UPI003F67DF87